MPPNFANPTGYWEPTVAVALNERFLQLHSSSWYDATLRLQSIPISARERVAFIEEAAAFLADGFEPDGPLVIKDPRISAFLPFWIAAAERAGLRQKIIHNFRRPDDVAMSLACRDELAAADANALWLKYNLLPERDGRFYPRVFVSYEALMKDWRAVATRCIDGLDLALAVPSGAAVSDFLSAALHHHASVTDLPVEAAPDGLLTRIYRLLRDAEESGGDPSAFDAGFQDFAISLQAPSRGLAS